MVERIMLFKLVDVAARDEIAQDAQKTLSRIGQLEELSVGIPADEASGKSWDMSVVMGFATAEEAEKALGGAIFQGFMEQQMAGRYEVVKAWSFSRLS